MQNVSYAEAMRKVEDGGQRVRESERIPMSSRPVQSDLNSFLVFITMVIICTTRMEMKSQEIELVVAAVETFWGVRYFSAEELHGVLRDGVPASHADGLVYDLLGPK